MWTNDITVVVLVDSCECVCVQLVSEEHDKSNAASGNIYPLSGIMGLELTEKAEHVPLNDITVWIDPLDATQEYTGMMYCPSLITTD